jgi:chromosome partitioning protein
MRKIAVINFKGGTGKTTTVVNVGAGLAMRGNRVLLVDVDAQGSLAISLGLQYDHSLGDVLTGQTPIQNALVRARRNLDIVPSDNSLLAAQRVIARFANWQDTLGETLASIDANYDFIILDCAASLTPLNINALNYATEIFIPTQVEYLSMMGLNQVLENLARGRFPNQPRQAISDLGISLIIPTMYDVRKRQSRRLLAELRDTYRQHVSTPIRTNVRLSEAPSYHKVIYEYDGKSAGAFDYNRLVDTILQESLLVGEEPINLQHSFRPSLDTASTLVGVPALDEVATPEDLHPRQTVPVTPLSPPEAASASHFMSPLPDEPGASPMSLRCPYCGVPLTMFVAAGYRIYQCERCGYQKQMLMRDLRSR